jgi:hypothetical protein
VHLQVWSFQGRLGAITQTVVAMVAPMAHFLLLLLICMATFAAMVNISVGRRLPGVSDFGSALGDTFMSLLGGSALNGMSLLRGGVAQSGVEVAAAAMAYLCQQLLLVVVLANFFLAIIEDTFSAVKRARARAGQVRARPRPRPPCALQSAAPAAAGATAGRPAARSQGRRCRRLHHLAAAAERCSWRRRQGPSPRTWRWWWRLSWSAC